MDKRVFKKTGEELQEFLQFRKKGYYLKNKKGKGSYDRSKFKKGEISLDKAFDLAKKIESKMSQDKNNQEAAY